mgnify:FL=1
MYSPTASGIATISGIGDTREIQNYGYYGDDKDPGTSGGFTFSNTPLVHPFVDYTPSIGIGVAVLYQTSGTGLEAFSKAPYQGSGNLKKVGTRRVSFIRSTYVGIGEIRANGIASTEYAIFEEPRTYVVII